MLIGLAFSALMVIGAAAPPPIVVDECSFVRAGSFEHSVRIVYRNVSNRTAKAVTFDVHNGPHAVTVRDHGDFAPHVRIDRVMTTPTWEFFHAQPHTCAVTHVTFSDGTSWSR